MCVTPIGLLWLDNFFRVMQVSLGNYQPVPVSTYQIDYQIKQMTTQSDARSYWYQGEGHTFYVLTFPTDGKTFEYNLSTGFCIPIPTAPVPLTNIALVPPLEIFNK